MDSIIQICLYIGLISGGIMVALLLLSLVGGLDIDIDLDIAGDVDVDTGAGLGVFKSVLAFISISSLTVYVMLKASVNPVVSFFAGVAAGVLAVLLIMKKVPVL